MSADLEYLKARVLELSSSERDELLRALLCSVDGDLEETAETIENAWNDEVARRVADDQRDRVAQRCVRLDGQQRAEISSRMIAMSLRTPTDSGYAARLRKNAR